MHNNAQIIAKNAHFFATMSSDELKKDKHQNCKSKFYLLFVRWGSADIFLDR